MTSEDDSLVYHRIPYAGIAVWVILGIFFIWAGGKIKEKSKDKSDSTWGLVFQIAGVGTIIGSTLLSEVTISVQRGGDVTRTWRPLHRIGGSTITVPASKVQAVIYGRTVTRDTSKGGANLQQRFWLALQTPDGRVQLFPWSQTPLRAPKLGRRIAAVLQSEYKEALDEGVKLS